MSEIDKKTLQNLRIEYSSSPINESAVDANPISFFGKWFDEAMAAEVREPNAMTLATATRDGIPSARIVLLKGADKNGFSFYSNYLSRKGKELAKNPSACLVFFWPELGRQVRIEGKILKLSKEESEAYFATRPFGSQLGAIVSPQSQVIANREVLDVAYTAYEQKFEGKKIPKPAHWGGYILNPIAIEFWQGRESRLHDRVKYVLMEKGKWKIERLAP
ncbi:MAG: pyridoxamine 5-phosphate oxidase [Bacteroidota bacterium]|jgi:pyridoxamine 5'-phosphate oxidase